MTWPTKTDFVDGDVLTASQVNNIGTNLNIFDPTSATVNQVPIADGAGSAAWGSPPSGGMTLIATSTPTSGTTVTFSTIPGTYINLYIEIVNNDEFVTTMTINGVTSNYRYIYSEALGLSGGGTEFTNVWVNEMSNAGQASFRLPEASGTDGQTSIWIYNYAEASTQYKLIRSIGSCLTGSNYFTIGETLGYCSNATASNAITSITFTGTTFSGGTTFNLYGVK